MIKGIIYKYTSPSGKVYIGQTTREQDRRAEFLRLQQVYGGAKINNARAKYKPENFTYEVLERFSFNSVEDARRKLDEREIHWISYYDSYKSGYNSGLGGDSNLGHLVSEDTRQKIRSKLSGMKLSEETKKKISESNKGKHKESPSDEARQKMSESHKGLTVWNKGKHYNEEQMQKYQEGRKQVMKPIYSVDSSGNIVKYSSIKEASQKIGCTSQAIQNALVGRCKTCKGYKWYYDN